MTYILNIESSTEVCSVVLSKDGSEILVKEVNEGLKHSEFLTVFIEDILKKSKIKKDEIDAIAVSKGPGSYTGLRIGVSVAKGLSYGLNIPLIAISTLDAMAHHIAQNTDQIQAITSNDFLIAPMIDARRMEGYTALYNAKGERLNDISAKIIDENSYKEKLDQQQIIFAGNATEKIKNIIHHNNAIFSDVKNASARFMQHLSLKAYKNNDFEDVAYFEPFYLKDFVVTKPKKHF